MCGITGFVGMEDKALVKAMADIMNHRGPDQEGFYTDQHACLGHRRLSIIDLSENGRNPMKNEDGTVWVVFNGEIYNFLQLKLMLETRGHTFYSKTDTEVLVHLYEEFGPHLMCEKLDGMFAFALWDAKQKRLMLARDRFGKKPLYYTKVGKIFYFASEIKALTLAPGFNKSISRQALHDYLSFRYVPEPGTLFEHVHKVPPAHYMIVEGEYQTFHKYWALNFSAEQDQGESYYEKRVYELLEGAVRKRLISDVPLGVLLSGGLDSSSIVGLMSRQLNEKKNDQTNEPVKTFTVGFNMPGFEDELKAARIVADHFKTDHSEIVLDFNPSAFLAESIWHADEPVADPALIPTMLMSRQAKKKITVTLLGEGADEVFGGYEQYKMMLAAGAWHEKAPSFAKGALMGFAIRNAPLGPLSTVFRYAKELGEEGRSRWLDLAENFGGNTVSGNTVGGNKNAGENSLGNYPNDYSKDYSKDYFKILSIFNEQEKLDLYGPQSSIPQMPQKDFPVQESARILYPFFSSKSVELNNMLSADMHTFLTHLLLKVDKMTMAGSVEARVPFLDKDLVEFMARVPSKYKINGLTSKFILRKAMKDLLPSSTVNRKKQRFFVPVHRWLQGDMKAVVQDALSVDAVQKRGLFQPVTIQRMLEKYDASPLYFGRQVWTLLTLEAWMRLFVDPEKPLTKARNVFDKKMEPNSGAHKL